jgi:glycine betaine/proline transport system substrate-binding protein
VIIMPIRHRTRPPRQEENKVRSARTSATRFRARTRWRGSVVAVVGLLALAACGSPAPAVVPAPGVQPTACGQVRLPVHAWVGYEANVAVVSYLLRHELGCTVATKDEAEEDSWKRLAAGQEDAILENWGHDDLKKRYIDKEKVIVEAGLTGNKGVIGWYVPPWMAKQYPDITNWQNLNKYAHLFKNSKTGSKGELLDGDPTYVTNDKDLVQNLKLDFKVIYAGSEDALIKAFRSAEENKTPLLGYFYSPQWLLSEIDLVHITLPAYTPGCDADPDTVKCDYQPYDLDKIMNKKFAYSGSPAAELIKNFQWTNNDQNQVARDITDKGLSPDKAAKKWLDGHRATWQKWLPSTS